MNDNRIATVFQTARFFRDSVAFRHPEGPNGPTMTTGEEHASASLGAGIPSPATVRTPPSSADVEAPK